MKKAFLISIMAILMLAPVVAKSTGNTMTLKGYYEAPQSSVVFEILDTSGNSALLNYVDIPQASLTASTKIFEWRLTGNVTSAKASATITFSFSLLQALLDGVYCVPAYTIRMDKNTTTIDGTNYTQDNFILSSGSPFSITKQETEMSVNPNGFISSNDIRYSGSFQANKTGEWVRSGSCYINITDYNSSYVGDFNYTGEVKVTITTN